MILDAGLFRIGWNCKCPACTRGDLYRPGLTLNLRDYCDVCGLDFSKNDSADGPAVFLIFLLGFLLAPLALLLEVALHPPLWIHAFVWSIAALAITLLTLRPLKAYIIAIQHKHRPQDWR